MRGRNPGVTFLTSLSANIRYEIRVHPATRRCGTGGLSDLSIEGRNFTSVVDRRLRVGASLQVGSGAFRLSDCHHAAIVGHVERPRIVAHDVGTELFEFPDQSGAARLLRVFVVPEPTCRVEQEDGSAVDAESSRVGTTARIAPGSREVGADLCIGEVMTLPWPGVGSYSVQGNTFRIFVDRETTDFMVEAVAAGSDSILFLYNDGRRVVFRITVQDCTNPTASAEPTPAWCDGSPVTDLLVREGSRALLNPGFSITSASLPGNAEVHRRRNGQLAARGIEAGTQVFRVEEAGGSHRWVRVFVVPQPAQSVIEQ